MDNWNGRRVVVIGAARQGLALARYLLGKGARVVLNDHQPPETFTNVRLELEKEVREASNLEWVLGEHPSSILEGADLVCISGGVPLSLPLVVEARKMGILLSNDSQIFIESAHCTVVGITGSAGKTTVTTLVGRIATAAMKQTKGVPSYRKVWVGGNIGNPLINHLDEIKSDDLAILELSSFQLELMTLSPNIAAVLNITPNHLDRHESMEVYTAAKARILDYQNAAGIAILSRDDPATWSLLPKVKGRLISFGKSQLPSKMAGVYLEEGAIYLSEKDLPPAPKKLMDRGDISLRGEHNLLNVMAACAIASGIGLDQEAMKAGVQGFSGVPHRLEFVRTWKGVSWYNDSIATTPERTIAGMSSFSEPLVLLAGGRDKHLPWGEFAAEARHRVDHLILFGEAAKKIYDAVDVKGRKKPTITCCDGLKEAVLAAARTARPGDVVLLSPGGTSFDEFIDFEERGECFIRWVNELI